MTDPARRPWWKKKRWVAALAVWLVVMYPLGAGPFRYALIRGWLPDVLHGAVVQPMALLSRLPIIGPAIDDYDSWWIIRGYEAEGWSVMPSD